MNILLIENESFLHEYDNVIHWRRLDGTMYRESLPSLVLSICAILDEIHFEAIVINANILINDKNRSNCAGIELLKFIRLHRITTHCIIYSFLSKEQLITLSPNNLIIFSPGVSFQRLPYDFKSLCSDYQVKCQKTAPDDLEVYFRAQDVLPDNSHFVANWWGVLRLCRVQEAIESLLSDQTTNLIELLPDAPKREMNSFYGLIARYLHDDEQNKFIINTKRIIDDPVSGTTFPVEMIDSLTELEKIIEDLDLFIPPRQSQYYENLGGAIHKHPSKDQDLIDKIKQLTHTIHQLVEDISLLEKVQQLSGYVYDLDDFVPSRQSEYYSNIGGRLNQHPPKDQEIIDRIKVVTKEVRGLVGTGSSQLIHVVDNEDNASGNLYTCKRYLQHISKSITTQLPLIQKMISFREVLINKKPKILFVDDQANDGWSFIFQRIIYGGDDPQDFISLAVEKSSTTPEICSEILNSINGEYTFDLLILDLRLLGEKDKNLPIEQVSGIEVLRAVKGLINCPILITSASNKLWSYQEVMLLGANGYWVKEGLERKSTVEESIVNYCSFVDMVYTLCYNEASKVIYHLFGEELLSIENTQDLWWQNKRYRGVGKSAEEIKKNVVAVLKATFTLLQDLFQQMIQKNKVKGFDRKLSSMIIVQSFHVLEQIHEKGNGSDKIAENIKKIDDPNLFVYAQNLCYIRNTAAHSMSQAFVVLKLYLAVLLGYLLNKDYLSLFEKYHLTPLQFKVVDFLYEGKVISIEETGCEIELPKCIYKNETESRKENYVIFNGGQNIFITKKIQIEDQVILSFDKRGYCNKAKMKK